MQIFLSKVLKIYFKLQKHRNVSVMLILIASFKFLFVKYGKLKNIAIFYTCESLSYNFIKHLSCFHVQNFENAYVHL